MNVKHRICAEAIMLVLKCGNRLVTQRLMIEDELAKHFPEDDPATIPVPRELLHRMKLHMTAFQEKTEGDQGRGGLNSDINTVEKLLK